MCLSIPNEFLRDSLLLVFSVSITRGLTYIFCCFQSNISDIPDVEDGLEMELQNLAEGGSDNEDGGIVTETSLTLPGSTARETTLTSVPNSVMRRTPRGPSQAEIPTLNTGEEEDAETSSRPPRRPQSEHAGENRTELQSPGGK